MEKNIHELNSEFLNFCIYVREKKRNSFEIIAIIFKIYRKLKSSIQKGF